VRVRLKRLYASILIPLVLFPLLIVLNTVPTYAETVYSGPNYSVVYVKREFVVSNSTILSLKVASNGKPLEYGYTLVGITINGAVEVKRGRGFGRVDIDLSSYVVEVKKILERSRASLQNSGVGLLAFIVTMTEESGEKYISTDVISIPIIPGKVMGASIEVNIEFKPVFRVKYQAENSTKGPPLEPLNTSPPPRFDEYCRVTGNKEECWYWQLDSTIYASQQPEFIPLSIIKLDPYDGDRVKIVELDHVIMLGSGGVTKLGLNIGMKIGSATTLYVPGVGFIIQSSGSVETIYSYICKFYNRKIVNGLSYCYDGLNNKYLEFQGPYGEALLATGFDGYIWLVKYKKIYEVCWGASCSKYVIDEGYAVFLVPQFISNNRIEGKYMLDDNLYDDDGLLEAILDYFEGSMNITRDYLGWYGPQKFWFTRANTIKIDSGSTHFAFPAIPVGAIIMYILIKAGISIPPALAAILPLLVISISINVENVTFYNYLATISFETEQSVYFNPYYYKVQTYFVKDANNYYAIPAIFMDPYVW
jgi:hypothetical protein